MSKTELNRRDFGRLTAAAFGGVVAGSLAGCPKESSEPKADVAATTEELHVCRGLNTCKGAGKSGDNACAGQGTCATAEAHSCHTENACKGQGGCGEHPGQNDCKGKGECAVPLSDGAWQKARAAFEKLMQEQGKPVGAAPAA